MKKKLRLEKLQSQGLTDQASDEKFRRLFEAARDGILLLDAGTGEITDANPFIEAILGCSNKELIGRKLWEIVEFKEIAANQAAFTILQNKPSIHYRDVPLVTKGGKRRNVEFISNVYRVGRQKIVQCNFRDITESKLAVNSLAESEERYRDLFDNASLGIFKTSANGRIIVVNRAFARMFGYGSPEELKSLVRDAADVFADPQRRAEIIQLKAEHPELTSFESLYRRKDGSTFFGSLTVRQGTGRDGQETLFEGFIEDISERKRAERALRESELKSRIIFENSTAGVALVGLDGKYLMVNPAFCEIHGYSAEELLKMNFFQVTHPDDIELSRKTAQEVVRGGSKSTRFFKRYIHKDGHTIWAEVSSALVHGIDGQPEYFITHVIDITEHKRMEEALRKSETELRALIEEIPAIIYTESADEPGITLYISPQIEAITGYTPAEWMGSANFWDEIVHPEDLDYLHSEDERTNRTGEPFHAEYRILKRDGSELWMLDEAVLIKDGAGKGLFWQGIMHDISDKKRAEKAQHESEERYQLISTVASDYMFYTQLGDDGSSLKLNWVAGAFEAITGYTKEEYIARGGWRSTLHPDDLAIDNRDMEKLRAGQPVITEIRTFTKAGNIVWVRVYAQPVLDGSRKKLVSIYGAVQDITERKRAEASLQLSLKQAEHNRGMLLALNQAGQAVQRARSPEEVYISIQEQMKHLGFTATVMELKDPKEGLRIAYLGYGSKLVRMAEKLTGLSKNNFRFHPRRDSIFQRVLEQGETMHVADVTQAVADVLPEKLRALAGPTKEMLQMEQATFAPLTVEGKAIGVLVVTGGDLSEEDNAAVTAFANQAAIAIENARLYEKVQKELAERERAEQSLANERNLLRSLIDTVPDFIYVKDTESRFVLVNMASVRGAGYSRPEESLGKTDFDYFPEELAARYFADDQKVLRSGEPLLQYEEPSVDAKGNQLWLSTSKVPLRDAQGKIYGLVGTGRDITERKQTQVLQEAVYRIAAATETTSSLDELYPQIHQIISSVMPAENFYIALYDEAQDLLRFSYFRDAADEPFMGGIQPGKGLTSYVLRTGKALLCTQAVHDELERRGEVKLLGVPSAIWLGVPLIVEGKTIGAMVVQHYTDPKAYGEREQHVLEFVSTQVAIAINRKRAETELQASREAERSFAERLTILSEVTTELSKAENLDTLCRRAVELGRERLDFDRLSIFFLSEDSNAILGTFGVDVEGRITDERGDRHPINPEFDMWSILQSQVPILQLTEVPLYLRGQVVGQGTHVFAGLWDGDKVIGSITLDNLLRQRPFSDRDCEIIRLFASAVGHLISLKRAQEGLRASEERYRMLFELSPDSIAVHQDGKVIITNPSAVNLLGASGPEEVIGRPVMDLVHPDYHKIVIERTRQQITNGKTVPVLEEKFLRLDGSAIDVDVTAAPVIYRDRPASMVIFRDISERKHAAEALERQSEELNQRNEELARLYRASGSLLSGASSSLQELAETILGVVQKEFGQANCSLLVVQRDSNELQRLATAGPYAEQVKEKTLTLDGQGLVPRAIREGETVNVGDVRSNSEHLSNWEAARSEMTIPLKIGSEVIGVIDVQSSELNAFSQDDERLMTIFAQRAALALEHSRLYEQAAIRVQQLAALRTVDMAISSSFDINLTLGILLDQLSAQLGIHAADILVYDPVTQTFRYSCGRGFRTNTLEHTHLRLGEGFAGRAAMERQLLRVSDMRAEPPGSGRFFLPLGENFVGYMGVPLIAKGQIKGVLEVFQREPLELNLDQQAFLEMLAGQAGIAIDNASLFEQQQRAFADLNNAYDETLEGWASALELRDKETEGHTRRVTDQTIRLAQAMGVKKDDLVHIYRGALLHDIGKIGIPDGIVLKPGPLTEDERKTMHMHPNYAYKMLSRISYLREAVNIPYCHHEKWNGTGYPRGLKGLEIPLAARIFSVVDVWDALTSDRPYRKAWTDEKALQYIREQAGLHFDPAVVEAFLNSSFVLE